MNLTNLLTRTQIFILTVFTTILTFAQEDGAADLNVDVNVDKGADAMGGDDWMSNPVVWVIGALVLILIIALVARGGGGNKS